MGQQAVTVYSPPMTGNRPDSFSYSRQYGIASPVVAQCESGKSRTCQDPRIVNPLVAGSSPAGPTLEVHYLGGCLTFDQQTTSRGTACG